MHTHADSRWEIRPRRHPSRREEVNKSKAAVIIIYYIKSTCVYISNSRWEKYLCAGFLRLIMIILIIVGKLLVGMMLKNLFPLSLSLSLTHFHRDLFLFLSFLWEIPTPMLSRAPACTKLPRAGAVMSSSVCARETMIRVEIKILSAIKSRAPGQWSGGQTQSRPKTKHTNPHRAHLCLICIQSGSTSNTALLIEIIFLICASMDTPLGKSHFDIAQVVTADTVLLLSSEIINL